MTAVSGGDKPDNDGRFPSSSVLDRAGGAPERPRPATTMLDRIFPPSADSKRDALLQQTWRAFSTDMDSAVTAAIDRDRSAPEIAYAVGEIVHNFFRARGVTLTSHELRQLVAELLERHGDEVTDRNRGTSASNSKTEGKIEDVVSFAGTPPTEPWSGDVPTARPEVVSEQVFEPPPTPLVEVLAREEAAFDRLLAAAIELARGRLMSGTDRETTRAAIASAIDKVIAGEGGAASEEFRQRLESIALSELYGMGLIDRLWTDRTVHAVFVNGPSAVYVEREGRLERVRESFHDELHWAELARRLVPHARTGIAEFRLRDGTSGIVVLPPAAPHGPVLAMRRPDPGAATFERLIAGNLLSAEMADVLRIVARCRLNMLVSGPSGSGKTALLCAIAHDLAEARIVTLANHRSFRSSIPSRVELVVQEPTSLSALLAAAVTLRPDLLVVDAIGPEAAQALADSLAHGTRGIVATLDPALLATGPVHGVDLVVRLARGRDGLCRVASMHDSLGQPLFVREAGGFERHSNRPAFASAVQAAGLGEALAACLR
jgi:pilus assembly protein CpaF